MRGQWRQISPWKLLSSCGFVAFSHLSLASIPRFLHLPLISMLPVAVLVLAATTLICRFLKRLLRISAPAPFVVVFHILFIWGIYLAFVRHGRLSPLDVVITGGCPLLLYGMYRIHSRDPRHVAFDNSYCVLDRHASCEAELQYKNVWWLERVRICNYCHIPVRGFDHHCPAFGTCIGKKNHHLFMVLVIGFILVESCYIMSSTQVISEFMDKHKSGFENNLSGNFIVGTLLFSILQLLWQPLFLAWHIYCICVNIRTDEWINWKNYPEFQHLIQTPGKPFTEFTNPYNKGIVRNIKDYLKAKHQDTEYSDL